MPDAAAANTLTRFILFHILSLYIYFFFYFVILYEDAVRLFAAAVRELDATEEIEATKIDCQEPEVWEHGKRIAEYMRLVSYFQIHKLLSYKTPTNINL